MRTGKAVGEKIIMGTVDRAGQVSSWAGQGKAKGESRLRSVFCSSEERVRGPTRLVNEGGREKAVGLALASSLRRAALALSAARAAAAAVSVHGVVRQAIR